MIPPKELLKKTPPFSYLADNELDELIGAMEINAFEEGETIIPKNTVPGQIFYIYTGRVLIKNDHEEILSSGELFPISLIMSENEYLDADAVAIEDTVCYIFEKQLVKKIALKNSRFKKFFEVFREKKFSELAFDKAIEEVFLKPVSVLISRPPVTCYPSYSVKDAAEIMLKSRVGSVVVTGGGKPSGIFTDTDLKRAVSQKDIDAPVSEYMTRSLITSEIEDPVFEAYVKMMENGITHLIITRNGNLEGVISIKDILSIFEPFAKIVRLYAEMRRAKDFAEMKEIFNEVKREIKVLALRGLSFKDLSRMISSIYDWTYVKVLVELSKEFSLEESFSWINMGSSGRREQIIATDQDNAVITENSLPEDFLEDVNDALDYIGIPKCKAGYMAVKWHYTIDEWKKLFSEWFSNTTPKNLRLLTVFLDMRHMFGNKKLYDELFDHILEIKNKQTMRFLALDAVALEPPIGFFGIKDLEKGIDLKKHAIYPIVNAVRVFAIDNSIQDPNTLARISHLIDVFGESRAEELKESFEYIQNLRLKHQIKSGDNVIKYDELEKLDVAILRESLKIIKNFQKFVKSYYGVDRF
ncbi:putative nucleotidyltransferase substrate binding domain-containing protein [Geoglobus acetivorans]|uniref:DUF294 nucleotidyltransferase-like domain-containing protein n=1 Tax=Geoglobus acetivorans TaxID=565033 RepID=A0ABZ3H278_GEOAI|nr:CBS domain-containing protein [Geoglobus acetivorans]